MAKLKAADLRNMADHELEQKVLTLKEELFKLYSEKAMGRIEKPHKLRECKKEIARIYTIAQEKKSVQRKK